MAFKLVSDFSNFEKKTLKDVELDTIEFLGENDDGFRTFGVSAGIVYVIKYKGEPWGMYHWGNLPGSKESEEMIKPQVDDILKHIKDEVDEKIKQSKNDLQYDKKQIVVYALGGQKSSKNTVEVLQKLDEKNKPFGLNTDELLVGKIGNKKIGNQDCFDLVVSKKDDTFYVLHHAVPLREKSKNILHLAKLKNKPTQSENNLNNQTKNKFKIKN